jgi:hypothetical protein
MFCLIFEIAAFLYVMQHIWWIAPLMWGREPAPSIFMEEEQQGSRFL